MEYFQEFLVNVIALFQNNYISEHFKSLDNTINWK
jgi:hypothetical protein